MWQAVDTVASRSLRCVLLTLLIVLTVVAVLTALAAFLRARHVSNRLERLVESYWELRYEHGQLRARVARLEPQETPAGSEAADPAASAQPTNFVPLSSLKK